MDGLHTPSAYAAYDEEDAVLNLIAQRYYQQQNKQTPLFDYHYLAANSLRHSIVLEQEKSFDRVQKWLLHQHEFSRHPPPEEDSWSSLRSSSAVEAYNLPVNTDEYNEIDIFPRYRSEEQIHSFPDYAIDNFKFGRIERQRYYSPNLMRRRYSPRSDHIINKTTLYPAEENDYKFMQDQLEFLHDQQPPAPVNYYFYPADKGNTFPRRRKETVRNRSPQKRLSSPHMGQHLDTLASHEETYGADVNTKKKQIRPKSMVEGRSFVLNSMVNKEENSTTEKSGSMIGNMSLDTQRLLSGNLPDIALTAAKALHKRELSDSMTRSKLLKQPSHVRMSSAPEPTRMSYADNENVQLRKGIAKRVPTAIRKVKASSWPKRAILPTYEGNNVSGADMLKGRNWNITESGYNTEKSEEKLIQQTFYEHAIKMSDVESIPSESNHSNLNRRDSSDNPPERPPLPLQRVSTKVAISTALKSIKSSSDCTSTDSPANDLNKSRRNLSETDAYFPDVHRTRYCSHTSNSDCMSPHADLSKTVSMSLKDLIRLHEQEIARVSAGASTSLKGLDKLCEARKTSLIEHKDKHATTSSCERHTTIGLTNYSSESFQDSNLVESHSSSPSNALSGICEKPRDKLGTVTEKKKSLGSSEIFFSPTPNTPPTSRRKYAPSTFPKPKKTSIGTVIVEPSFINVSNAREQIVNLTAAHANLASHANVAKIETTTYRSDAAVQTEITRSSVEEDEVETFRDKIEEMKIEFEYERRDLLKKLEEQKKVANAYQKLEDRYRRKVCSLQKAMRICTCAENRMKTYGKDLERLSIRQSISPSLLLEDNQEISVQKVDGILHQLEAWLNHQSGGGDVSEISSVIESTTTDEVYSRYKITSDFFSTPPLEIIDKIDATSV